MEHNKNVNIGERNTEHGIYKVDKENIRLSKDCKDNKFKCMPRDLYDDGFVEFDEFEYLYAVED